MTLIEKIEAASHDPANWDVPGLLADAAALLNAWTATSRVLNEAENYEDLRTAIAAIYQLGDYASRYAHKPEVSNSSYRPREKP